MKRGALTTRGEVVLYWIPLALLFALITFAPANWWTSNPVWIF